jgi:hypothetical protein
MKKIFFTAAILIACLSFKSAHAQLRVSLGLNINNQPEWGPTGYDHADYYYMPDIGVYYDVPAHQYIYQSNNVWVRHSSLPAQYRDYDLYHGYKVVVNQPRPWRHDADIRVKYANYRGRRDQEVIRDNHDERYRNHWHDNGRHNGDNKHGDHGRGHDHGHGDGH